MRPQTHRLFKIFLSSLLFLGVSVLAGCAFKTQNKRDQAPSHSPSSYTAIELMGILNQIEQRGFYTKKMLDSHHIRYTYHSVEIYPDENYCKVDIYNLNDLPLYASKNDVDSLIVPPFCLFFSGGDAPLYIAYLESSIISTEKKFFSDDQTVSHENKTYFVSQTPPLLFYESPRVRKFNLFYKEMEITPSPRDANPSYNASEFRCVRPIAPCSDTIPKCGTEIINVLDFIDGMSPSLPIEGAFGALDSPRMLLLLDTIQNYEWLNTDDLKNLFTYINFSDILLNFQSDQNLSFAHVSQISSRHFLDSEIAPFLKISSHYLPIFTLETNHSFSPIFMNKKILKNIHEKIRHGQNFNLEESLLIDITLTYDAFLQKRINTLRQKFKH